MPQKKSAKRFVKGLLLTGITTLLLAALGQSYLAQNPSDEAQAAPSNSIGYTGFGIAPCSDGQTITINVDARTSDNHAQDFVGTANGGFPPLFIPPPVPAEISFGQTTFSLNGGGPIPGFGDWNFQVPASTDITGTVQVNCLVPTPFSRKILSEFRLPAGPPPAMPQTFIGATSFQITDCGDGIVNAPQEDCDDGNNTNGDGCSSICKNEVVPVCGNGVVEGGEFCDDGDATNNGTCNAFCSGNTFCGDAVVQNPNGLGGNEQCDNAGLNSDVNVDACRTTCQNAGCGDNVIDTGEQCDDGNTVSGDGCSNICQNEGAPPPAPANANRPRNDRDDASAHAEMICKTPDCQVAMRQMETYREELKRIKQDANLYILNKDLPDFGPQFAPPGAVIPPVLSTREERSDRARDYRLKTGEVFEKIINTIKQPRPGCVANNCPIIPCLDCEIDTSQVEFLIEQQTQVARELSFQQAKRHNPKAVPREQGETDATLDASIDRLQKQFDDLSSEVKAEKGLIKSMYQECDFTAKFFETSVCQGEPETAPGPDVDSDYKGSAYLRSCQECAFKYMAAATLYNKYLDLTEELKKTTPPTAMKKSSFKKKLNKANALLESAIKLKKLYDECIDDHPDEKHCVKDPFKNNFSACEDVCTPYHDNVFKPIQDNMCKDQKANKKQIQKDLKNAKKNLKNLKSQKGKLSKQVKGRAGQMGAAKDYRNNLNNQINKAVKPSQQQFDQRDQIDEAIKNAEQKQKDPESPESKLKQADQDIKDLEEQIKKLEKDLEQASNSKMKKAYNKGLKELKYCAEAHACDLGDQRPYDEVCKDYEEEDGGEGEGEGDADGGGPQEKAPQGDKKGDGEDRGDGDKGGDTGGPQDDDGSKTKKGGKADDGKPFGPEPPKPAPQPSAVETNLLAGKVKKAPREDVKGAAPEDEGTQTKKPTIDSSTQARDPKKPQDPKDSPATTFPADVCGTNYLKAQKSAKEAERDAALKSGTGNVVTLEKEIKDLDDQINQGKDIKSSSCQDPNLLCSAGTFARRQLLDEGIASSEGKAQQDLKDAKKKLDDHLKNNCSQLSCDQLRDYRKHLSQQPKAEGEKAVMLELEQKGVEEQIKKQGCLYSETTGPNGEKVSMWWKDDLNKRVIQIEHPDGTKEGIVETYDADGKTVVSKTTIITETNGTETTIREHADKTKTIEKTFPKNADGISKTTTTEYNADGDAVSQTDVESRTDEDGETTTHTKVTVPGSDTVLKEKYEVTYPDGSTETSQLEGDPNKPGTKVRTTSKRNPAGQGTFTRVRVNPDGSETPIDQGAIKGSCSGLEQEIFQQYKDLLNQLNEMGSQAGRKARLQVFEFERSHQDLINRLKKFPGLCGNLPKLNLPCPGDCQNLSAEGRELQDLVRRYNNPPVSLSAQGQADYQEGMANRISRFLKDGSNTKGLNQFFACQNTIDTIANSSVLGRQDPLINQCESIPKMSLPPGLSYTPAAKVETVKRDSKTNQTIRTVTDEEGNVTTVSETKDENGNTVAVSSDGPGGEKSKTVTRGSDGRVTLTTRDELPNGVFVNDIVEFDKGTVDSDGMDLNILGGKVLSRTTTTTLPNGVVFESKVRGKNKTVEKRVEGEAPIKETYTLVDGKWKADCDVCRDIDIDVLRGYARFKQLFQQMTSGKGVELEGANGDKQTVPSQLQINQQIAEQEAKINGAKTKAAKQEAIDGMTKLANQAKDSYDLANKVHDEFDNWKKNLGKTSDGLSQLEKILACHSMVKQEKCKNPFTPKEIFEGSVLSSVDKSKFLKKFRGSKGGPGGHDRFGQPRKWVQYPHEVTGTDISKELPNGDRSTTVKEGDKETTTVEGKDGKVKKITITSPGKVRVENLETNDIEIREESEKDGEQTIRITLIAADGKTSSIIRKVKNLPEKVQDITETDESGKTTTFSQQPLSGTRLQRVTFQPEKNQCGEALTLLQYQQHADAIAQDVRSKSGLSDSLVEETRRMNDGLKKFHDLITKINASSKTSSPSTMQLMKDLQKVFDANRNYQHFPSLQELVRNAIERGLGRACPEGFINTADGGATMSTGREVPTSTGTKFVEGEAPQQPTDLKGAAPAPKTDPSAACFDTSKPTLFLQQLRRVRNLLHEEKTPDAEAMYECLLNNLKEAGLLSEEEVTKELKDVRPPQQQL